MSPDQTQTKISEPTIYIVDDEESARKSMQRFLKSHGFKTITFASAMDFLAESLRVEHGCLILDLQMPKMSGIELQQELVESGCELPIIFLTAHGDIPNSVKAMKQGAEDFLPKMADERQLLEAIERALQRSLRLMDERTKSENARASAASLTDRERQVCQCVISGMLNKQIASRLAIAERTVKAHRAQVMQKFGVESVADLVRITALAGVEPVVQ